MGWLKNKNSAVNVGFCSNESDPQSVLFSELITEYGKKIYNAAFRLTNNHHDAEDLIQETLLRIFKNFYRYDIDLSFECWAYRIMYNLYIDKLRKKRKYKFEQFDEKRLLNGANVPVGHVTNTTQYSLEKAELSSHIETALKSLPLPFRMAVILCDLEGLSYEEISKTLECSIGTVRSRIHRGRKLLAKLLEHYYRS